MDCHENTPYFLAMTKRGKTDLFFFDFGTQNMEMRDYAKNLLILVCCKLHKKLHQQ